MAILSITNHLTHFTLISYNTSEVNEIIRREIKDPANVQELKFARNSYRTHMFNLTVVVWYIHGVWACRNYHVFGSKEEYLDLIMINSYYKYMSRLSIATFGLH